MKHTSSTFEAENRCLDKLAQPELKKKGCLYKKVYAKKHLLKAILSRILLSLKVYKDLCLLSDVLQFIVMATVLF